MDTVHGAHGDVFLGHVADVCRLTSAVDVTRVHMLISAVSVASGVVTAPSRRVVLGAVSCFLRSADVRYAGGWPHQSGRRMLRTFDFL